MPRTSRPHASPARKLRGAMVLRLREVPRRGGPRPLVDRGAARLRRRSPWLSVLLGVGQKVSPNCAPSP